MLAKANEFQKKSNTEIYGCWALKITVKVLHVYNRGKTTYAFGKTLPDSSEKLR